MLILAYALPRYFYLHKKTRACIFILKTWHDFDTFRWVISSSIKFLFLKSVLDHVFSLVLFMKNHHAIGVSCTQFWQFPFTEKLINILLFPFSVVLTMLDFKSILIDGSQLQHYEIFLKAQKLPPNICHALLVNTYMTCLKKQDQFT